MQATDGHCRAVGQGSGEGQWGRAVGQGSGAKQWGRAVGQGSSAVVVQATKHP